MKLTCLRLGFQVKTKEKYFGLRFPMSEAGKKWVMAHSNQGIYPTPLRLHTFRFETRMRTGRTLGTTKLGHLPSIPSRCSLGCRQCTTLQFMAITTAERNWDWFYMAGPSSMTNCQVGPLDCILLVLLLGLCWKTNILVDEMHSLQKKKTRKKPIWPDYNFLT